MVNEKVTLENEAGERIEKEVRAIKGGSVHLGDPTNKREFRVYSLLTGRVVYKGQSSTWKIIDADLERLNGT